MADRAQKHLFNDGALITFKISALFYELKDEVSPIIDSTTGNSCLGGMNLAERDGARWRTSRLLRWQSKLDLPAPFGDGVSNLIRYALGVPDGESSASNLPRLLSSSPGYGLRFPFESGRHDIAVIVESSDDLNDWSGSMILFVSRIEFPPASDEAGRIKITDIRPSASERFYRLRVVEK